MKKALLYLILLLLPFGCQRHYQYPLVLQEADSLCVAQPDSAVALLKSISDDMRQETEHIQMRYKLLTIKANDKAYINHTSDSLILSLVDYYEHGGDPAFLGEAYYYAGSTYRDLGDAPRALEYYQKALDAMPGNENLKVKSKVYAQMGSLFHYQNLYREALKQYMNSLECDKILHDTVSMVHNLLDMGYMYRGLDMPDSTLILLDHALRLAKIIDNSKMVNMASSQLSSLYIRLGDFDKAKDYIQPLLLQQIDYTVLSSAYTIAANIYYHTNQFDSAAYYYTQLLEKGTIYSRCTAYERLAHIALNKWQDSSKALAYTDQYLVLQDSINRITATESIAQMNSLYNYQLRERENARLQIQRQNYYILFLGASFIVVVLLSIGFFFVRWYINRRKQYRETLNHILAEVYRKTDAYIEEKKLEIEEVERILGDLSYDDKLERSHQEHRRESLRLEMERAKEEQEMQKQRNIEVMHSEIQDILKSHVNDGSNMKTEDWSLVEQTLEYTFPGYSERLKKLSGMTEIKYRVCLLAKLQQRNSDIAVLVNRTPSAITRLKERFIKDLGIADTSNISFDSFISSL